MESTHRIAGCLLVLLVASSLGSAAVSDPHIRAKWKIAWGHDVGAIAGFDADGDGLKEIFVGYQDNTVKVFNGTQDLVASFSAGSVAERGEIRALQVGSLAVGGPVKVAIAYNGRHVVEEIQSAEYFNRQNKSMQRLNKWLTTHVRREGGVALFDLEGVEEWFYPTQDGINDLSIGDLDGDGVPEIAAALGAPSTLIYYERTGEDDRGIALWEDVEYQYRNGSVLVLKADGSLLWRYNIRESDKQGKFINKDYQAFPVQIADIDGKYKGVNVVSGANNGRLYILNGSGGNVRGTFPIGERIFDVAVADVAGYRQQEYLVLSADNQLRIYDHVGDLLWAYKFRAFPKALVVDDIDFDESVDLVVGAADGVLYILNASGAKRWEYTHTESMYGLIIEDLDANGNPEVVVQGLDNVSVLELREDYVKLMQAEGYFAKAKRHLDNGDHVNARIFAEKTKSICIDINDDLCLGRVNVLLQKIDEITENEILVRANHLYDEAVKAYSFDNYTLSMDYLAQARKYYYEINYREGIENANILEERIETEICVKAELQANTYYAQARNYYGYQNMTGALKLARQARKTYENISGTCEKDMAGSIANADAVIGEVARNYYRKAETYYNARDYDTAAVWVRAAVSLFEEGDYAEGTVDAELLQQRIEEKRDAQRTDPRGDFMSDLLFVGAVAAVTVALLFIYRRVQRRRDDF